MVKILHDLICSNCLLCMQTNKQTNKQTCIVMWIRCAFVDFVNGQFMQIVSRHSLRRISNSTAAHERLQACLSESTTLSFIENSRPASRWVLWIFCVTGTVPLSLSVCTNISNSIFYLWCTVYITIILSGNCRYSLPFLLSWNIKPHEQRVW
jgi:hypothetical protein